MSSKRTERINFSSIKKSINYPDFLDIQIKSFKDFFQLETKSEERQMKVYITPSWIIFQFLILEINLY